MATATTPRTTAIQSVNALATAYNQAIKNGEKLVDNAKLLALSATAYKLVSALSNPSQSAKLSTLAMYDKLGEIDKIISPDSVTARLHQSLSAPTDDTSLGAAGAAAGAWYKV